MRTRIVLVTAAAAAALAAPAPARASCAELPPLRVALERADVAFVGEVTSTRGEGRAATVRVTEVWKGDVAGTVEVVGGETAPNVASSADRSYAEGRTYLFVPYDGPAPYRDNACTATRPLSERVERLRPAGAAPPDEGAAPRTEPDDGGWSESVRPLVGAALLVALVASVLRTRAATLPRRM